MSAVDMFEELVPRIVLWLTALATLAIVTLVPFLLGIVAGLSYAHRRTAEDRLPATLPPPHMLRYRRAIIVGQQQQQPLPTCNVARIA